ncbi:MAG: hypothetical protein AAB474_01900 [Patescibacteria group bacterium]
MTFLKISLTSETSNGMKKTFLGLIFLFIIGAAALFLVWSGAWFHILKVNGVRIRTGAYFGRVSGFEHYRRTTKEELDENAVKRGIVFSLIREALIKEELAKFDISDNEIKDRIEKELNRPDGGKFEKATEKLYGWTSQESMKFLIEPQIRQDILAERLEKDGKDFNEWLKERLQKADVKVRYLPYVWQNGELVDKPR